ncbi:hypothetical protein HK405_012400 [Cladochytrium tenue]|nr:hypothetical protein HK405_012400 [Cladochytrium tenue]
MPRDLFPYYMYPLAAGITFAFGAMGWWIIQQASHPDLRLFRKDTADANAAWPPRPGSSAAAPPSRRWRDPMSRLPPSQLENLQDTTARPLPRGYADGRVGTGSQGGVVAALAPADAPAA